MLVLIVFGLDLFHDTRWCDLGVSWVWLGCDLDIFSETRLCEFGVTWV